MPTNYEVLEITNVFYMRLAPFNFFFAWNLCFFRPGKIKINIKMEFKYLSLQKTFQ